MHGSREAIELEVIGDPDPIELKREIVAVADLLVNNETDIDAKWIMHADLSLSR